MPSLEALLASDIDVAAAVANPDRPAGRGMELRPPPVKVAAQAAGLEVRQPERAGDPGLRAWLEDIAPDAAVVVAYGKILPASLLAIPRLGFVNLHFSLLPQYRGAAPVQRAIMEGRTETGVSVMVLTQGMDEGPVLAAAPVRISDEDNAGTLGDRLARIGAALLVDSLRRYGEGSLVPVEQDHRSATYAPKVSTEQARLDWRWPSRRLRDMVRGLHPAPGAWTTFRGARVKVWSLAPALGPALAPGALGVGDGLVVGAADGPVAVAEAQLETKRRMSGAELARGLRIRPGERFE